MAIQYYTLNTLKEPCKKYNALTAERLPQVDLIPKMVLGISKLHFMYNGNFKRFPLLMIEITY